MSAIDYDFTVEQSSDFVINFQYSDENNNPIDLSSKCIILQIKADGYPTIVMSSQQNAIYEINGFSLNGSVNGEIALKLSARFTNDNFVFDTALYELDILTKTDPLENIRLSTGSITVRKRNIPLLQSCPVNNPEQLIDDLCLPTNCSNLDAYSVVYDGSALNIPDNASVTGVVSVSDTRLIENIDLVVNNLQHVSPTDLQFILMPPAGDSVLLSANEKISEYRNNFNFMFSNKAKPNKYLRNIKNGEICGIVDKTDIVKFENNSLVANFDNLFNTNPTGQWKLIVRDTDPVASGSISGWKLVITYQP